MIAEINEPKKDLSLNPGVMPLTICFVTSFCERRDRRPARAAAWSLTTLAAVVVIMAPCVAQLQGKLGHVLLTSTELCLWSVPRYRYRYIRADRGPVFCFSPGGRTPQARAATRGHDPLYEESWALI